MNTLTLRETLVAPLRRARGAVAATDTGVSRELALHVRDLDVPLPEAHLRVSDWRIQPGERLAVIGRNGVGKTSLVEALLGLRSGARVDGAMLGHELRQWQRRPCLRTQLGVQLQRVFFPGRPRISELVDLHRQLYPRTSPRVMEALGIPALSRRLYEFLSRGETQRVDLFLALAHEPRMLFLDEPFTGLDASYARNLGELVLSLRDTTLLMCCHTIEELRLTTHTAWLSRGGILRHAPTDALRRDLVGDFHLTARCVDAPAAQAVAAQLPPSAAQAPRVDGDTLQVVSPQPLADLARQLSDRAEVLSVHTGHSQLGDLLRHCARES